MQNQYDMSKYNNLFDIKKTQLEMVRDRGYNITQEELFFLSPQATLKDFIMYYTQIGQQHKLTFRQSLRRVYVTPPDETGAVKQLYVYYGGKMEPHQKQVPAEDIRILINQISTHGIHEAIIIVDAPLSTTSSRELAALTLTPWQVFDEKDLAYNPTQHIYTSKHTKIPKEDVPRLLRELKVRETQLTIFSPNDVIVKYYGWKPGDIIKVEREDDMVSVLCTKSVNYRMISSNA